MKIEKLKELIDAKLSKRILTGRILLSNMCLPDEEFKELPSFTEPRFYSFYYYLGTLIQPKNLFELGFDLGLSTSCFLKGCKTVGNFLAFRELKEEEHYSLRLGFRNIKVNYKKDFNIHIGTLIDEEFIALFKSTKFDLAFINQKASYDKYRLFFDFIWPQISSEGFIIMDYLNNQPSKDAYLDFCKAVNRNPVIIETRYEVGIIQK